MTEEVMNNTLTHFYPARLALIKPLQEYSDKASLYMIASNNNEGKQTLDRFNKSLRELQAANIQSLRFTYTKPEQTISLAKLITAEGYPVIVGETEEQPGNKQYYTLPTGTSVAVLTWNENMQHSSDTDRLYKNMMRLTEVLILNGPLVGKVLYIRNMNIELL
jgi:polar amino acid transport system substrate-binding protein